ncbi:MAG: putative toxin-antitoxin system toxin component, PIN family [Bacteroidales bacterium]|nr:putative toxin-antitoxin system toxin component, PIN family [Bacteroidales bacterium]MCM1416446.1 putative toxin-antitoxin system toxin component, PIN family [bacterium]MCM1424421.1 putative toxin-antitoxin system toxin component, PIN family [bacterium]
MIWYVAIDTNVLVSALLSGKDDSATVQVVSKLLNGEIIPLYNTAILEEYHNVLSRPKFKFSPIIVDYLLNAIEKYGISVMSSLSNVILPDIKDLPFYEVTMEKRNKDSYLITGNIKHFPKEPFIVTPREFLDIFNKSIQ